MRSQISRTIVTILLTFGIVVSANAQVSEGDSDMPNIENTNKKSKKKYKGTEKSYSAVEEYIKSKMPKVEENQAEQPSEEELEMMSKLLGSDVQFELEYAFISAYVFDVQSTNGKGDESNVVYEIGAGSDGTAFLMEILSVDGKPPVPRGRMIFDHENKSLVSLIDDGEERTGFVMSYDPETPASSVLEWDENGVAESPNVDFRKTGKTRSLNGYTCDQYVYTSSESEGEMWLTSDEALIGTGFMGIFSYGQKKNKTFSGVPGYPNGFVMEMTNKDTMSGDSATMRVTDIMLDKKQQVNTTSYQVISMGNLMGE